MNIKKTVPKILVNFYHFCLPLLGAFLYRFPSKKIVVIGVTGTNGKSTVVSLTTKILEEAGYKAASLSSIKFKIGEREWPNLLKMTMPGRLKLQRFLRQAVNAHCQYAVLEITSEGIKQHRHRFIDFDVAVLTNLTPEHIEAHGSFENYRKAKLELFQVTKKTHIINLDDKNAGYFLNFFAIEKWGYSIEKERAAEKNKKLFVVQGSSLSASDKGITFEIQNKRFDLNLLGRFNVYNALAAVCVGLSQGIDLAICQQALEKIGGVPGRMEKVIDSPFRVFVDYAFTPNALEQVYRTLANKHESGSEFSRISENPKLICVLGACGGGRDKWKRPVLGKLAGKYCDKVIVTNEDPYDEDPMEIINQVASGASEKAKKILDRREAIRQSLKVAQSGDTVVITGKGCEPWICVANGKKIPWDDRQVVREEFKKLKKSF